MLWSLNTTFPMTSQSTASCSSTQDFGCNKLTWLVYKNLLVIMHAWKHARIYTHTALFTILTKIYQCIRFNKTEFFQIYLVNYLLNDMNQSSKSSLPWKPNLFSIKHQCFDMVPQLVHIPCMIRSDIYLIKTLK